MQPGHKEGASINKVGSFAERLASDCKRLAAMEQEGTIAGLFVKLAEVFEEAAAAQRCQAAPPRGRGEQFEFAFDPAG